ncbi:MAG: heparinase II/III family protein, partial [Victivallaceae bacterium]
KISWESIRYGRNPAEFANTPPPVMESALFKDAGHAILRSNGEKKLTAVFSFAPYRGFHSHFDMLSFIFFGFGQEICVDPGRAESQAYRLPVHKFWYKGTVSHNAVLVDFKPQGDTTTSELLFFDANSNCPAAAAKTENAYPGVDQTRLLALTPDYLLALDVIKSNKAAIFNWICHFEAEKLISDSPTRSVNAAGLGQGFEYIKNAGEGKSINLAKFELLQQTFKTCLTVFAKDRLNFFTGDGPKGSIAKRCPLVIVSNADKTKSLAFAATLEPVKNTVAPTIKNIELSQNGKLLTIKVFRTGGTDVFTYDGKNKFSAQLVK